MSSPLQLVPDLINAPQDACAHIPGKTLSNLQKFFQVKQKTFYATTKCLNMLVYEVCANLLRPLELDSDKQSEFLNCLVSCGCVCYFCC